MILSPEDWMNIRRFRVLHETGSSYAEIARECGVDPRTVKKYLEVDADVAPPRAPSRALWVAVRSGAFGRMAEQVSGVAQWVH